MAEAGKQSPQLDAQQEQAVKRKGQDVCVVAGPGSGKTRVLVERFAHLVDEKTDPEKILAITFTEKAANEIKSRLAERLAPDAEKRRRLERAQISTIHGFCHALLRQHALRAGLDPRFEVLDDIEAKAERLQAMRAVLDDVAAEAPQDFLRLAAAWPAEDMAEPLLALHEAIRVAGSLEHVLQLPEFPHPDTLLAGIREQLECAVREARAARQTDAARRRLDALTAFQADLDALGPEELLDRAKKVNLQGAPEAVKRPVEAIRELAGQHLSAWAAHQCAPQRDLVCRILRRFDEEYRESRKRNATADFLDLEELTLRLLDSNPDIRQQVQDAFEYILMDELQDTNPIQWKILDRIRRPGRFFAVGDINQSIYGFRHAEPRLFESYEQSLAGRGLAVDRLEANYRTRPEILEAVTRILIRPAWDNKGVRHHELRAGRQFADGERPYVEILCADRAQDEGTDVNLWLAARLRQLHGQPLATEGRPARFSDMAVFVRNSGSFSAIEAALKRFSIPYVISGGRTFFESSEVIDLLNLLRVIAGPENEIAAFALLRSPFFGVSDEEILRRRIDRKLLLPEEAAQVEALRRLCMALPVSAALARFLDETGYQQVLDPLAAANVQKFLRMIEGLEGRAGRDAAELVREIETLRDAASEANAPVPDAVEAVQVMTIHKAKGLEFPIVAVAALEKRDPPEREPALYEPELGLGFKWRLASGTVVPDPAYSAIAERAKVRSQGERDRLLYVALTRAKERLLLVFTNPRRQSGDWHTKVQEGLGLRMPDTAGVTVHNDVARITRVSGEPEIPAAPPVAQPAPAIELNRQAPEPEAPARVSVTALALFSQCPRRYLLASQLGWTPPAGGEGGALELGTEVHEYLSGQRHEVSREARQLAAVFEQSGLARRAGGAGIRHHEMDFLVEMDGTLLHGQIDLWFDEGRGPVIVDYKTDQYLSEARHRGYELQLRLYAMALQRITGRAVQEAWLFPLREGQPHRVNLGEAEMQAALAVLNEWRRASAEGDFPPREQPDCQWCPFAGGACPVQPGRGES